MFIYGMPHGDCLDKRRADHDRMIAAGVSCSLCGSCLPADWQPASAGQLERIEAKLDRILDYVRPGGIILEYPPTDHRLPSR